MTIQTPTISGFKLAPQQKRIWLLQQNSSAFCSQCAVLIEGKLQLEILQNALDEIVKESEILRTNFYTLPGVKVPVMVINDQSFYNWEYLDLTNEIQLDIQVKIREIFWLLRQNHQNNPLNLFLIQVSSTQHILIISLPALCADSQTLTNLVAQISDVYVQCDQGTAVNNETVQYIQFSEWQNQLLTDEDAETTQEYWQQQLNSHLSSLKLPDQQISQHSHFITDTYKLELNQELIAQIEQLAQKYQTSVDVILLACWKILIWKLTGESEIIIGTASSRREYEELKNTLGLLATWLPIKTQLQPNLQFSEVLAQVIQSLENAIDWQDYFTPEFRENEQPLVFPFGFEFVQSAEHLSIGNLKFTIQDIYSCIEIFKVKIACLLGKNTLTINLVYDVNYFTPNSIQRLASQLQTLLGSVINQPELSINQLNILNSEAYYQLLVEFNQTQVDEVENYQCIHELFTEQAIKTPDHVAVVFENQSITYSELNRKSNQLAHYLQKRGVKPDVVVGLCVERSIEMIIGLLGIIKAGGAYLPLEPNLPIAALNLRLQTAQTALVITQQSLVHNFENNTVINLDQDWGIITNESVENPEKEVKPENLVYIIFTSGSTGIPKAVATEHRQLCNYIQAITNQLHLPTSANYATVSSLSADLGNTMIFPALCRGGCLHIISSARVTNAVQLAEYFQQNPIDCLKIVPAHLSALLASTPSTVSMLPRQCLILGGEAVSWKLITQIQQQTPTCKIFNHYGPTETTIGVLTYAVGNLDNFTADTVPLGRPLANTQVYILDEQLKPVPIGVPGELYIGGAGLSRGYLNQPELTAKSFISHSLLNQELRLYKTGDKVRYLENGNIEFLGRVDNQVKIRGYRIELEEIEINLTQHPDVQQAVVIAREEILEEKRLIAYIVLTNQNNSELNLRNFLKAKLPEYMIPTSFIILKALPLTTNGKVDRNALPAPEAVVNKKNAVIAPRTPIEEVLAGIWGGLLNLSAVSIDDNFFDLGGHSLLATQVISRICTTFGVEIPLSKLFELPNLAALAQQIEIALRGDQQEITNIIPVARDKNIPVSFAQQRLWFFEQVEPGSAAYNLPRIIRLQGNLNINALVASFQEIIKRHEILRTSFVMVEGQPIQIIADTVNWDLSIVDLQTIPQKQREAELECLIKAEVETGFDLTQAPLFRGKILQLDVEECVILLTLHHIISDGWSTEILIRELSVLYTAFCTAKPAPLPVLPIQYADFTIWQRQWLEGEVLTNQLAYWQQQLAGELPILQLPTDRPRPLVKTYGGKTLSFVLPKNLTEALKDLSKQEGVTLFMTLLAGFKTLLYRYTGQTDILVGAPIANRNRGEIEHLIGFFVNTLVLRSHLASNSSFRDLLKQVREVALGAYAHQDLPFEKLVEAIQPERNLSYNPLFQVMFVFQNAANKQLDLPGLKVENLGVEQTTTKFDLTLVLEEVEAGLFGKFEYNTDLFDAVTIERLAANFEVLLNGIIAEPEQQLGQLRLLNQTEEGQLLEWSRGKTEILPELCLHQLFEVQVEKTPDAVAVVFESEKLTYWELNQRANQLAHYLQKLGIGTEVLVGICVERSLEMLVGILAILKAGGAYVPLDPTYPQERLGYMLTDAQVSVLLTQKHLLATLPAHNAKVICLDADENLFLSQSTANPISNTTSANLAYVIYTSGSTGQPKGVLINHGNVARLFTAVQPWYNFQQQDVWTLFHSYAFDFSVWEIWGALLYGGRLVVVPYWVSRSPAAFYKLLSQEQVTILNQTPSAFRQLIKVEESTDAIQNLSLRLVIFGGEALDIQSLRPWFARHGDKSPQLVNMYGITETTIHVTYRPLTVADLETTASVIGRPIPDLSVYLLDQNQQLVPIGVAGEMYIGGSGVARGYLHRSDITDERFITHPLSQEGKLYKSGDLARYLPNGELEYLGRIDYQVKIRGFRIEIGEIEAALNQYPDVGETVVIAREDVPGNQRLVAYLGSKNNQVFNISQLRSFLQAKLPSYMLPEAFVVLDSLPLTANGKVDRRALPAPDKFRPELEVALVLPQTEVEKVITGIWQQVLKIEQIGIDDNFFDLGGHSLLMVRVHEQLRTRFNTNLSILDLFRYPTVSSLSKYLSQINQQIPEEEIKAQTEKIASGKLQQKNRREKMKANKNI
ncbi:MAG TPA: amino acid adenylation domain-containing protein [Nostocaceae cyanobacterium]|nr:amino acid adenylation domain-containing protein [Nostocaceae cyanobacterium]